VTNALIAAAISFAVTFLIQWKIGFADVPSDEDGQAAEKSSITHRRTEILSVRMQLVKTHPIKAHLIKVHLIKMQIRSFTVR